MFRAAAVLEARPLTMSERDAIDGRPSGWELVVGLEVHVELATATKLFCGCPNQFGDEPNTNIGPVTPRPARLAAGAQPRRPSSWRCGSAWRCNCTVQPCDRSTGRTTSIPDMPKDYQISQYDQPINVDGWLDLPDGHAHRHRARPPRGGHRQVDPRRRRRSHPRRRRTRSSTTTAPACRWSRS